MTTELLHNQAPARASGRVDQLQARAITRTDDIQRWSFVRETDARTAIARGLREHIERLSINWAGGRLLKFEKVFEVWGEPEEPAVFPSLAIVGEGPAEYQDSEMAPRLIQLTEEKGDGSGRVIKQVSEVMQTFVLIVWCTDPVERQGLVSLVEDAMEPADYMTGLLLELPYYFNSRAIYERLSLAYEDSAEDARRRWRKALILATGTVTQIVPIGDMVLARPRLQLHASEQEEV
jgi:hypothetical protein